MDKAEVPHNSLHYIILTFTCITCSLLICINIDPYILSAYKMEKGNMNSSKIFAYIFPAFHFSSRRMHFYLELYKINYINLGNNIKSHGSRLLTNLITLYLNLLQIFMK